MTVTAAKAAKKAMEWAETAETALKHVDEYRGQARRKEGAREGEAAAHMRLLAEDFEMYRVRSVEMATMWADVAGVLHLVEDGEPK